MNSYWPCATLQLAKPELNFFLLWRGLQAAHHRQTMTEKMAVVKKALFHCATYRNTPQQKCAAAANGLERRNMTLRGIEQLVRLRVDRRAQQRQARHTGAPAHAWEPSMQVNRPAHTPNGPQAVRLNPDVQHLVLLQTDADGVQRLSQTDRQWRAAAICRDVLRAHIHRLHPGLPLFDDAAKMRTTLAQQAQLESTRRGQSAYKHTSLHSSIVARTLQVSDDNRHVLAQNWATSNVYDLRKHRDKPSKFMHNAVWQSRLCDGGRLLLSESTTGWQLFDVRRRQTVLQASPLAAIPARACLLSPDGNGMLAPDIGGQGATLWHFKDASPHILGTLTWDDGIRIGGLSNGHSYLWAHHLQAGQPRTQAYQLSIRASNLIEPSVVHPHHAQTAAFSADNSLFASLDATGVLLLSCLKHAGSNGPLVYAGVRSFSLAATGQRFLLDFFATPPHQASEDVFAYDPQTKTAQAIPFLPSKSATSCRQFSLDGTRLANADEEGNLRVWSWSTTHGQDMFIGNCGGAVSALRFASNGRYLLASCSAGNVLLWPLEPNSTPLVLDGHTSPGGVAEFSPDGRLIVVPGTKKRVHIYDFAPKPQLSAAAKFKRMLPSSL